MRRGNPDDHRSHRRAALTHLQNLWVTLGNQKTFMTERHLAEEVDSIGEIHAELFGPDMSKLH
jgi:hypothetical protein